MRPFNPTVGALLYVVRKAPEFAELVQQQKNNAISFSHNQVVGRDREKSHGNAVAPLTLAQEEAWVTLLKIFGRFDPDEEGTVTPRKFCLAVSVLLSDDDVVFTKEDWFHVINFYTVAINPKKARLIERLQDHGGRSATDDHTATTGVQAVDYMTFCEMLVSPNPIYAKEFLKVEQNTTDNVIRQRRIGQHPDQDSEDVGPVLQNRHGARSNSRPGQRKQDLTEEEDLYQRSRSRGAVSAHRHPQSAKAAAEATDRVSYRKASSRGTTSESVNTSRKY